MLKITEYVAQTRRNLTGESTAFHRILVVTAAGIPALLYFFYVFHYAVNVPTVDDWSVIPFVDSAIHGHLAVSNLWNEWGEARIVVGKLVFAAFGLVDHLNERSVLFFSALLFIASCLMLLVCFRSYLGQSLSFLPVLVLGIVWFSLVDAENSLWSFQLSWYLVIFFLVVTIYLLLVPQSHRRLFVGLGIGAAVLASLSFLQGFLVWPVGLICLLWANPWTRKTYYELAAWVSAASLTMAIYFRGYTNPTMLTCRPYRPSCTLTVALSYPVKTVKFFVLLVGNVIPTTRTGIETQSHLGVHELQGSILFLVASFVLIQSIRERRLRSSPLPLLLIAFALLFDLTITLGRLGLGLQWAAYPSRYTMPNVILLVGIVMYAWAHAPKMRKVRGPIDGSDWLKLFGFGTLIALLFVQGVMAMEYGIPAARDTQESKEINTRILVNLDRVPQSERSCYVDAAVRRGWYAFVTPNYRLARRDHLSLFQSGTEGQYRAEGLPSVSQCDRP